MSYGSTGAFFILTGLPKGSDVGIDTKLWQTNDFSGFKFIPTGLHLLLFASAPSNSKTSSGTENETLAGSVGIRHGLFRFFETGETVVEAWSVIEEQLVASRSYGSDSEKGEEVGSERRKRARGGEEDKVERTVVSEEYLKSLDKSMAPFPTECWDQWKELSLFISERTISRVVGFDQQGSARVDALVEGSHADGFNTSLNSGDTQILDDLDGDQAMLEFAKYDLKRSWPKGSVGQELTRWSQDKSWLLGNVVKSQLNNDAKELLAEFQLSLVLFALVHNYSSMTVYRNHFSLICRSSSALEPQSTHLPDHSSLPLIASFLDVLRAQLDFFSHDFFSAQLPQLETFFLNELSCLLQNLSDVAVLWTGNPVWREVTTKWNKLTALTMEKFGWELGMISTAKKGAVSIQEGELDLEDLEEGEDAPVVVELDV